MDWNVKMWKCECTFLNCNFSTECLHYTFEILFNNNKKGKLKKKIHMIHFFRIHNIISKYKKKICLQCSKPRFNPWVRNIPCRRKWIPTPAFLLGEFHGQRSLAGYSPWDHKQSDMTEWLTTFKTCMGHHWLNEWLHFSPHYFFRITSFLENEIVTQKTNYP